MNTKQSEAHNPNRFLNLFFTIIIPVYILNKGSKYGITPLNTLFIALSFPLFIGIYSIYKNKKMDYMALLGLLNILFSGIFTLMTLEGIWFAVKEALFPLLIGAFVLFSSFGEKPFFESLFLNPQAFDTEKINAQVKTLSKENEFKELMRKATLLLSVSFLMSALLNFFLAVYIFKPLPLELNETQKQDLLNQQLSQMTAYSMFVILVPSILFLGLILFYTFKKMKEITGLTAEDLFLSKN